MMSISKDSAWREKAISSAAEIAKPLLTSKVDFLEGKKGFDEDTPTVTRHGNDLSNPKAEATTFRRVSRVRLRHSGERTSLRISNMGPALTDILWLCDLESGISFPWVHHGVNWVTCEGTVSLSFVNSLLQYFIQSVLSLSTFVTIRCILQSIVRLQTGKWK
jgi:hypothetical protein